MKKKRLQKIVALLMIVAMILNLTPSGLTVGLADEPEPAANSADSTVADATTSSDWEEQMSSNSQVSSENIGRIWTDKSVTEDSVALTYGALAGQSIKKTDGADFLVELSTLSSTSSLTQSTTEAQPLDIVLVLDVSGSMDDTLSTEYTPVYTLSTSSSYYILVNETYYTVRYTSGNTGGGPGGQGQTQQAGWYYTTGNGNNNRTYVVPLTSETDTTSGSVQFYTLTTTTKMDALKDAVNNFIESVAAKNDGITDTTKQHQISVVKFAGTVSSYVGNYTYNSGWYTYNYTQILSNWTTYTKSNVSTLTSLISSLNAGGATYADDGLAFAQTLLSQESVRSDAQQVVIFFTDGEPNNGSGFWPSVASDAVNTALDIKDGADNVTGTNADTKVNDDVLVYSIAIYNGADSTDTTTNINAYLNAVSSNYPKAKATVNDADSDSDNNWASKQLSLGDRVSTEKDANGAYVDNYYLVAEDATGLSKIFTDILSEISASSVTSPTHIEGNDPSAGGYVTFEDELGAFMEVKGINAVVLEEKIYGDDDAEKPTVVSTVTNKDGSVTTTYQFPSIAVTGNVVHTDMGNLKDIVIEVVSYPDNPSKGDVVTVKIPATLLPLLYYDIDTANGVTSINVDYDWPLRFFYSVGLKTNVGGVEGADVADAMESGDYSSIDGLAAYVAANTDSSTGEVYFYSNYYDGTKAGDGYTYGDTTATFVPALTNSFYYFQSNVAIYTDKDCTTQLTGSVVAGTTYYYKNEYYYVQDANASTGVATLQSDIVEFSVDSVTATYFTTVNGYTYIAAGAPRVSLGEGQSFAGTKTGTGNATGTADYYLYPTWTVGSNAVTYLGNNGRIGYGAAGNLSVSKTVEAASNLSPDADAEFTFTVKLFESDGTTALTGSYTYSVIDSETGEAVTDQQGNEVTGTVSNSGTLTLKDGQTAVIIGLPVGSRYTVTENNGNTLPGGYSISDTTVSNGTDTTTASTISGTIVSATTAVADFTNTYKVEKVTVDTSGTISAAKILSGRSWLADDEFVFYLIPANGTTILPDTSTIAATTAGATATVTTFAYTSSVTAVRIALKAADGTADGAAVRFDLGSFTFTEPGTYTYRLQEYEGSISGITYSDATYSVVFTVTDNGAGKLVATYTLTQDTDDAGASVGTEDTDGVASFTNTYDTDTEQIEVSAYKSLNSGTPPVGSFEFKFTALYGTDGVKLPSGVTAASGNTDSDGNVTWTTTSQNAGAVLSGKIEVEAADAGKTYEYLVQEVIPDGATPNTDGTYTLNGVVYDSSVYKYSYTITYDYPMGSTSGDKVVDYSLTIYKKNANGEFVPYTPPTGQSTTEVTFYNTATVTIGDDTNAGIKVTKKLTGREWISGDSFEFTLTAGSNTASGSIATPMPASDTVTISYNASGNYTASFSEITYNAPGVYTYTLAETKGSIPGITYDGSDSPITVTVTVTQASDASLSAKIAYSTGENATSAEFTNSYDAEDCVTTETTFSVSKTISGRDWIANSDMFYFTIEAGASTDADGNNITTPMPSRTQIAASSTSTNPSFTDLVTYTEAGTYVYYIKETEGSISGITYDKSIYKVVVEVTDNYEKGELEAEVTYYKGTPDANGKVADSDWAAASSKVAAFTNTYKAAPYTTRYVGASKMIVGFDMEDGDEFTFTLEAYDDDTKAAVKDGTTITVTPDVTSNLITGDVLSVATVSGLNSGNTAGFTFGSITFTKAGVYMFAIKEVNDDAISGVTYDSHTVYAKVTVTDSGTGALSATIAYTDSTGAVNNDWTFININDNNNTKTVTGTNESGDVVDIDGELVKVGDALTYTISWTNDYYDSTGAAAAATVTIKDEIPDYTTLVENSISDGGTYDDSTRTITWTIDAAKAATGTVSFSVTVTGDTSAGADGESLVIANEAEVKAGANTTDKTNKTTNYTPLTVDNLFQVRKQIVDASGNAITGSTVYPWTVVAQLDENDSDEEYWFRFVLEAVSAPDGVTLESILPGTATGYTTDGDNHPVIAMNVYDGDTHSFGDGEVTYSAAGTYVYDIWERSPITAQNSSGAALTGKPIAGVSYAQTLYRLTVTVTFNDSKGVLEASYTITKVDDESGETVDETYYDSAAASGSNVMVIKNTYNKDEESISFRGIKFYTDESGATELTEGKFTFKFTTLTADEPVPTPAAGSKITVQTNTDGTKSWTVENATNGEFNSTSITYTSADVGTYYYKVEEIRPDGATDQDANKAGFQYQNMTYDTNVYYIQVVVSYVDTDIDTDNIADTVVVDYLYGTMDNGTFTVGGVPETDFGRIEFKNVYDPTDVEVETADTEAGFGLTKTIEGREWLTSDTFTFTLTADAGTPMPSGYSTSTDGKTVTATATVNGSDAANGSVAIDFGTITYSKVGTYTYTVTEDATDIKGVTIDGEARVITVVVKHDDQKNALYIDSLTVAFADPTAKNVAKVFTNTYESTGSTDEGTDLTKTLTGRTMDAKEFTFVITAVAGKDNNLGAASDKLAAAGLTRTGSYTVTNETGNVASDAMKILDNLTFTQADAGATYTYTVAEQLPTDAGGETLTKLNGVTYDQTTYLVEIYVQDNSDGTITPKVTVYKTQDEKGASTQKADSTYPTADAISFANTYEATGKLDGAANLKVAKTLTGRNGGSNETFTFRITALNDGDPMPEANAEKDANGDTVYVIRVNAPTTADGTSYGAFGDITFTEAGTYYYTISEVEGTNAISTWSKAEYQVTVEVTDNRDGSLKVEVTDFILSVDAKGNETDADDPGIKVTNATASFTNSYEEPKQTKDVADITEPTTSVNGKVVAVGDTLTYTINWTNTAIDADGNAADATEVVVTDTMPTGTAYVQNSAKVTVKNVNGGVYNEPNVTISYNNGVLTCTIKDVKANETGTVTFDVTVEESAKTVNTLTNTAKIEIGGGETKVDASTNPVTNYVPKDPVKAIAESSDGYTANPTYDETTDTYTYSEVAVNDTIEYVISYYNHNPEAADVTITDTLDAGVAYVEGSATNGGVYNDATRTITWKLSGVAAFATGTVSFKVTVTEDAKKIAANEKTATVENSASVQIGNASAVDTSIVENPITPDKPEQPTKTITENSPSGYKADAVIVENKLTGETVAVGDFIEYEIAYYNNTNSVATVVITDVLDTIVDFESASDNGSWNEADRTVTWNITADPFTHGSVKLIAQVNSKAVEAAQTDKVNADNQATVQVGNEKVQQTNIVENPIDPTDPGTPEKIVEEGSAGADGAMVKVGDKITYAISYYNHYSETATITITDTLDEGVTFLEASDNGKLEQGTVTWILTVKPFTSGEVTLTVQVNENAKKIESGETQATVENRAAVQIGNDKAVDTNPVENPVNPEDPEDPAKTVSPSSAAGYDASATVDEATNTLTGSTVAVGSVVSYDISYYNNNNTVADVIITDKLDEGVDFVKASDGGEYNEATHTVTWTLKNVAPFAGGTVLLEVQVNVKAKETEQGEDATIDNQASVQIGNEAAVNTNIVENPIDPDDPEEPSKVVAADSAGADGADVKVGDSVTYIISYYNHNNTPADVIITDTLDKGVDFVKASDDGEYDPQTHTVTWTLKNVKAFGEGTVSLTVTVNENAKKIESDETQATVENTASVQIGNETAVDTNTPENPVTPDDPEDPVKNVSAASPNGKDTETTDPATGKVTGSSVAVSDIVEYEISYYNNNNTVADVIITDKLDEGVDFVEASAGGKYDEATHTVTWTLKNVAPFTGGTALLQVQVNEKAKETIAAEDATIENQASVQIGNETAVDTNVVENPIDPDDPKNPSKVVAADSEGADNADVKVGDEITYIVSYYNHNSTAADITITDVLDPGVDFVSADGGTYDEATRTVTWTLKNVKAFGEGYVTLTVQVNANAKQVKEDEDTATVENTASVQIGNEPAVDSNPVENPVEPDDPENPTKTISSGSEAGYYDENGNVAVETDQDGTVTGGTVGVGGIIEYVIGYYNYENTTATITITDELDPGVMFVSAEGVEVTDISTVDTETVGDSYVTYRVETATDAAGNEVTTVIWTIFNVKPFTEGSVLLQVEVLEAAKTPAEGEETATVENEATAENSEDPDNTYTSNVVVNEISPDEPGDPAKMVTADSEAGVDGAAVDVGEEITYAITYYNHNQTKADVTITDALDIGVEFVGASNGGVYDEETHIVTWSISDVTAFTGGFVTVTVRVTEAALKLDPGDTMGDVENQAEVQVGDITNSTNIVVNPIAPDEPEEPTKIVDDSELVEIDEDGNYVYESVGIYDTITYEIEYYNHHNEIVIIEIIDKLDEGVDFITASGVKAENATDSDLVTWVYDEETHTVTWTIEELPWTGGTVSVTVQVNENAKLVETGEAIATVENEATVILAPDTDHETTMTSNKVIVPIDPNQPADPTKTIITEGVKEGDTVKAGDVLTYEIGFYNHTNEVATVTITDTLDAGVDYVSSTEGGVYDKTTHTVTWILTVAPFTEGSVSVTIKVNDTAEAQISNTAYVKIGNGTDSDVTTDPTDPSTPDKGTPTNIVTNPVEEETPAPTQPVPTTSDTEAVVPYTVMMLMAFAAIVILLKSRREENA